MIMTNCEFSRTRYSRVTLPVCLYLLTCLLFLCLNLSQTKLSLDMQTPSPDMTDIKWSCGLDGRCLCNTTYIDCHHRRLENLSMLKFPNTAETMDLSRNNISHLPDTAFSGFPYLKHLDLSGNQLKGLGKGTFIGLNHLLYLNLVRNCIPLSYETYPPGVFKPLRASLVHLRLQKNFNAEKDNSLTTEAGGNITYPDKALSDLAALEKLHIDGLPDTRFGRGFASMESLRHLTLAGFKAGYCNMTILRNDTFTNLPKSLRLLNMSDCYIVDIEPHAFKPLQALHTLDFSQNKDLGFSNFVKGMYGLRGSNVTELRMNAIVRHYSIPVTITPWHTQHFKHTKLETLFARFNRLETFCEGAFDNMPATLKHVDLLGNHLGFGRYFKDLYKLRSLETLLIDGVFWPSPIPSHYPPPSPQRCQGPGSQRGICDGDLSVEDNDFESPEPAPESMVTDHPIVLSDQTRWSSTKLDYSVTSDDQQSTTADLRFASTDPRITVEEDPDDERGLVYVLPPKLKVLKSRCNQLYYRLERIKLHPNNSLDELDISCNLLAVWTGPIVGLNKLRILSLADNFAYNVSDRFFHTLTSLKTFNGSTNNLRHRIQDDTNGTLFGPLTNLEVLDLSWNDINKIPTEFFSGLVNLTTLILAHNEIVDFIVNFDHMEHLRMLDLTYNQIHYFPQDVMNHLDNIAALSKVTIYVAIYYNPIACTCQHIDFLTWIEHSAVDFNRSSNYHCLTRSGGNSEPMSDFFGMIKDLERSCADFTGMLVGAVSCCFCLLVAVFLALAYRFRWKLRYLYYVSRLKYSRLPADSHSSFEYDAFVSYASEDKDFVHGELLERLEEGAGLKLNVHNRDWVPGRPIPSNIVAAVQSSRRTLVVLTKQLLDSDWCRYEMQMATMEASHTGRDVLLFLLYEDVPSHEIPREVFYNLKNSTYIQYPHIQPPEERLLDNFWRRVALAVKE